jgi:hypothetical protein
MSDDSKPGTMKHTEQLMKDQAGKSGDATLNTPARVAGNTPLYASPWVALYMHLKTSRNQKVLS